MQVGSIVFAPFKGAMWPGQILKLDMMAHIKLFRASNETIKVSANSIIPFTPENVSHFLATSKDKLFNTAIKTAQKSYKIKKEAQYEETVVKKQYNQADYLVKLQYECQGQNQKNHKDEAKLCKNEQLQICKNEDFQICKNEEDERIQRLAPYEILQCQSLIDYLKELNQVELISQSKIHKSRQFTFKNTVTKEVEKHKLDLIFVITTLIEHLLKKIWFQTDKHQVISLQKKVKNLLTGIRLDPHILIFSFILTIINQTLDRYSNNRLSLVSPNHIEILRKYRAKAQESIYNLIDDYSEIGAIINELAEFSSLNQAL